MLFLGLINVFPGSAMISDNYFVEFQVQNANQQIVKNDTIKKDTIKLKYSFKDIRGFPLSGSGFNSPLYLKPPANISSEITFDPKTYEYSFTEKIGNLKYGRPNTMSLQEYRQYDLNNYVKDTWRQKFKNANFELQPSLIPKLRIGGEAFDKIFGGNTINIRPQGSAELTFGLNISNNENPTIPEKLRRTTTFDFRNNIQMNVSGQIGQKVVVGINYNTQATFDFENKTKLGYNGLEDEIIKKIEAGNVSLPLTGSLITGSQSLFGLKTELQFGKLTVTSIFSQQKGESSVIEVEGGAQMNTFDVSADQYEANKHFFLSHYFKDIYDQALRALPIISSGITVTKLEVWITNKTSNFDNSRNVLALMDLAEGITAKDTNIFNTSFVQYYPSQRFPSNNMNNLYTKLLDDYPEVRDINEVTGVLAPIADQYGFVAGQDYEKIENARKLDRQEYSFHPNLGYISLKGALNSDEILAVAYEYTIGGQVFRVGEFSNEVTASEESNNPALLLKLLKGTNLSPALQTWELMMKNIYSIGAYRVNPEEFYMDVMYQNDKTGTAINYIPGGAIDGEILLKVMNLDNLNYQLDPQPDGVFDFIERITFNAEEGKIIFPVLEPFGSYLRKKIEGNNPENVKVADEYVFEEIYTMTQSRAQQIAEKNKFFMSGRYQSSSSSDIALNAMNIPQGSVVVTAGGALLVENQDYTVDYVMGRVKIINQGLLESGTPIKIALESQSLFSIQTKTLLGSHFNYKVNNDFNLGGTILHLKERPLTKKVDIGQEPISNTIWGINADYRVNDLPFLTRLIDKLPFIETKERSSLTFNGEFAQLIPGHSNAIQKEGVSYIDDFEGSQTSIDIKQRFTWVMASMPMFQEELFPEAELNNDVRYGFNRAKIAWYNIDPLFLRNNTSTPNHIANNKEEQLSHFTREVQEEEIFPYRESPNNIPQNISVLNLAFYPTEKGPYNYDTKGEPNISSGIDIYGKLKDPQTRWAGVMRKILQNDFEAANIEYIEFWMMDPFVEDEKNGIERKDEDPGLYFNLGNISEDILKDSRKSFENGLPTTDVVTLVDTTAWGRVPLSQSFVNAFDNDVNSREYQDVGLDGISDEEERSFFKSYLDSIDKILIPGSEEYNAVYEDPSGDNFHYFRGRDYDNLKYGILERYKKFNGFERNSPTAEQSPESYPTSSSTLPDAEDINEDNTISEAESYFQYKINLSPEDMVVGENYITDRVRGKNKEGETVYWYQFKVPVYDPQKVVGSIQDFKSIRFMRMFMRGFNQNIILRFATLDLVRGNWRKYNSSLREGSEYASIPETSDGSFEVSSVNFEENSSRTPVNYILPPGITRETDPNNPHLRQTNEQSIVLKVEDLDDGDAKAAYKNVSMDIRQYKKLQMDIHAEAIDEALLKDNDLVAFIRIGSDYTQNYYEYEVPLELTPHLTGSSRYDNYDANDRYLVWPDANHITIEFLKLQQAKQERNTLMRQAGSTISLTSHFYISDGNNRIIIKGNPNMSNIRTIMLGVRNPGKANNIYSGDDGLAKSGEIWMNELRLTDFDESGGWAGNARMTARLADFGSLTISGNTLKPGFGSIEKKVNDRSKEEINQYDISSSFELGKFFPQSSGVKIPVYVGFSEGRRNPKFNPLDPDIPLEAALDRAGSKAERDSIINVSQDYTRRKSFNVTNIKIDKPGQRRQPKMLSISNWTASYSFNEMFSRNINTEFNINRNTTGNISYIYSTRPKVWEPFKKSELFKPKSLQIFRDINFYYKPSRLSFISNINKQYSEMQLRNVSNPAVKIDPTFNKNFLWFRQYDVKFDLTKQLKIDFSANNSSRVDEPYGRMDRADDDYEVKRDSVWDSFKSFGRTTRYHHKITTNYTFPINKIPLFNWVTLRGRYDLDYDWNVGPITADTIDLGNVVQNANSYDLNGALSFDKLYEKVGFLKRINQKFRAGARTQKQVETIKYEEKDLALRAGIGRTLNHKLLTEVVTVRAFDKGEQEITGEVSIINKRKIIFTPDSTVNNARIEVSGEVEVKQNPLIFLAENTARILMGVKTMSMVYNSSNGTVLPGYKPTTQFLGQRSVNGRMAPGLPFIMGFQDEEFGNDAARNGWITTDSTLNQAYTMGHVEGFSFRSNISPLNSLKIDLTASRNFTNNISKYYIHDGEEFVAHNTIIGGNFTMTFQSWKSAFAKDIKEGDNYISEAFEQFKDNRKIISRRLAQQRMGSRLPGSIPYDPNTNNEPGYSSGYGSTSQEVLIPAFLAAYSGKDPNKISLSTFPSITSIMPNWNVTYDGLQKIEALKKYIKNFKVGHGYRSMYSIGAYTTNLFYDPDQYDGLNYVRDIQDNFLPEQQIGAISITESFSPLLNMDMTWNNSLTTRIEFRRSRNLTLSFANNQLMENRNNEIIIGGGYRFQQVPIIIKAGGRPRSFRSDINLRFDFNLKDIKTIIRKVSENYNKLSSGQRSISIKFSADYTLSTKLNLRFYYDQIINKPFVSLSFPTSNVKVGVSIKFTLAQ